MKRKVFLVIAMVLAMPSVWGYTFYHVTASGDTLFFNIVNGSAQVTYPAATSSMPYSGHAKPSGALAIPASVTYNGTTYAVTSIGSSAFSGCSSLTSVSIPTSVTTIDHSAFFHCNGLTNMVIPSSVTSIGYSCFAYSSGLTSITLSTGLTSIGNNAFENCTLLASIVIPEGVSHIESATFSGCSALSSVVLPASVNAIYPEAFLSCSSLTSITIPDNVHVLNQAAFKMCSSLQTVMLPSTMAYLASEVFSYCSSLQAITLPASVTNIGASCFYGCSSLHEINMLATTPPTISANTFTGTPSDMTIYIPCGSMGSYCQSSSTWNTYANNIISSGQSVIRVVANDTAWGTVSGSTVANCYDTVTISAVAKPHYYFDRWSDGNTLNPRIVQALGDKTYYAIFRPQEYTLTLQADSPEHGTCTSLVWWDTMSAATCGGQYMYLSEVTLTATPSQDYHFTQWNDGGTNNPRVFVITCDTSFTAFFEHNVGIGNVEGNSVKVYANDGSILIEGANGMAVNIYDMMGREFFRASSIASERIVLPTGVYMVRIDDRPVRKMVVVR